MGQELPATVTPLNAEQVRATLTDAWRTQIGTEPCPRSIALLLAHIAIETGLHACRAYNVGNAKAQAGGARDWCYFTTYEKLASADAYAAAAKSTPAAPCTLVPGSDDGKRAKVVLSPKHPGCCFRAYTTLGAGIADYFTLEHVRFAAAWQAVIDGDPAGFAHQLKEQHYYTEDEALYRAAMSRLFKQYAPREVVTATAAPSSPSAPS